MVVVVVVVGGGVGGRVLGFSVPPPAAALRMLGVGGGGGRSVETSVVRLVVHAEVVLHVVAGRRLLVERVGSLWVGLVEE